MLDLMLEILNDYGHEVPYVGKNIRCLFHDENRASARVFENGAYHCWSANCQVHFNTPIDAIMHLENCDFKEALNIAKAKYGYRHSSKAKVDLEEFHSLEQAIVRKVIQQKPVAFLSVYKTLDQLLQDQDIDKMKKLYLKLSNGEIK